MTSRQKAKAKRDKDLYNLLPDERELLRTYQAGRDPITGQPLKPNANVDHDHRTGLVRGLLNPMTNKFLVDDIHRLDAMRAYLLSPPAVELLGEVYGLIGKAKRKKRMLYGPKGQPEPQPRS